MTLLQRRWLAGALGTGLVALLLLLAALDNLYSPDLREETTISEVELYVPPPPPPPPPPGRRSDSRNGGSPGQQVMLESSRAPVALDRMQLDVQLAAAELGAPNLGGFGRGFGVGIGDGTGDGTGSGAEIELVTLSELDQQPVVVSAPVFAYPQEMAARGVAVFDVKFHILIDEEGRTYPIAVIENPFPALQSELLEFASKVRFSPPTRLGVPTRTEYLWPVRFSHR